MSPRAWSRNSVAILGHTQSRFYLILTSWAMLAILVILAGMPAVMETEFGITGTHFAILFSIHGLGIILGQFVNHKLIDRIGVVLSMIFSAIIMVTTFVALNIVSFGGWMTPNLMAAIFFFFAVGHLCVFANSISMIMDPHPKIAGFTAAFFGFSTQIVASMIALAIMYFVGDSLLRWSFALLCISIGTLISLLIWKTNPKYQAIATVH
jgi:DHA1 family bicyclomycin/chloramphenicol resistance-like MFS transporter